MTEVGTWIDENAAEISKAKEASVMARSTAQGAYMAGQSSRAAKPFWIGDHLDQVLKSSFAQNDFIHDKAKFSNIISDQKC